MASIRLARRKKTPPASYNRSRPRSGTGPIFGRLTYFGGKDFPQNLDLSLFRPVNGYGLLALKSVQTIC